MNEGMVLARVAADGGAVVVVQEGESGDAAEAIVGGRRFSDVPELLAAADGDAGRIEAGDAVDTSAGTARLSVVGRPRKVVCIGINYRSHAAEGGRQDDPPHPVIFPKWDNALTGPYDDVAIPPESRSVDWEAELAFVFSRRCRRVAAVDAASVVFGYAANDVSMRDWQFHSSQWGPGKSWERSTPVGPVLVPAAQLGGAAPDLRLRGRLNGETMQDAKTSEMIFGVAALVEYVTTFMMMEPGDLVLTGTTAGVGFAQNPPRFLADGDVFEVEIEGVGTVRNRFVAEIVSR